MHNYALNNNRSKFIDYQTNIFKIYNKLFDNEFFTVIIKHNTKITK
jgi:hypothetical protein